MQVSNIIAAIIPTFNRKECLKTLLICLEKQVLKDVKLYPIIIVDGSTDGTIEMLKSEFPTFDIVLGDGSWWYTKCINKGIEKALALKSSHIITLNDDIIFDENFISTLTNITNKSNKNTIVGSVSYTQSYPHRITFSGIKSIIRWRLKEINYIPKFSIVDPDSLQGFIHSINLSGRGMMFNIQLVDEIGLFDEKLVQYSSDTDFSYRAYKSGCNVYISYDARVFENEKLTSVGTAYNKPTFYNYYKSYFNKYSSNSIIKSLYYYKKHGFPILFPIYLALLIIGSVYMLKIKYRKT